MATLVILGWGAELELAALAAPGVPFAAVGAVALSLAAIAMLLYFLRRFGWLPNLFAHLARPRDGYVLELENEDPEHPRPPEEKQAIRLYYRAYHHDRAGRQAAALKLLDRAITLTPQWRFHLARASTLNILGREAEALAALEQARALSPGQLGYVHWGICHMSAGIKGDLGRFESALEDFAEAVRLCDAQAPEHAWSVYRDWGTCLLQQDDNSGALEKYEQASQLINFHCLPLDQELVSYQARALVLLDRAPEALALLELAERQAKDQRQSLEFGFHMAQGMVLRRQERFSDALQVYTLAYQSRRRLPKAPALRAHVAAQAVDALINRGTVYAGLGKFKQAAGSFNQAERERLRRHQPESPQLARLRAAVLLELHEAPRALEVCRRALRALPSPPAPEWFDLLEMHTQVLFALQRHGDALPELDRLVLLRQQAGLPESPDLHFNRAVAASNVGYLKAALEILNYVEQLREQQGLPVDPDVAFRKALVCLQGEDRVQACRHARQALAELKQLDPTSPDTIHIEQFLARFCPEG